MDALKNSRYKTSRKSNRRPGRRSKVSVAAKGPVPDSALGNNSESPVDAHSYKSVLSSRPPTAAGSDVPADDMGVGDRGADSYTSLLFSKHAWNPHDALLDLPSDAKSQGGAVSALSLDAEDEAFFSTLFDEVLNDAEQFTAGVGAVDIDLDIQPSFFPPVGKTLEEFDVSNVMYIASPELRDLVRRYPTRMKQELTESDVVEMTNATMTQSMITSEDIERTKAMMTQMLRSFDTSLGDAVQASHRNRTATTKTGRRGQAETNTGTNAAQFQTRNVMQSLGTDTCGALGLQTPGDAPGLPLDVCTTTGGLASPATFDTFTQHRTSSQSISEDWIENMLTTSSPSLPNLCDVKLLISPTMSGGAKTALFDF